MLSAMTDTGVDLDDGPGDRIAALDDTSADNADAADGRHAWVAKTATAAMWAGREATGRAGVAVASANRTLGSGSKKTREAAARVAALLPALLPGDLSAAVNRLVAAAVEGTPTIYDKAMDANYIDPLLRSGLGGSHHRLFDGGHTVVGAARAAHAASPDDTIIEEALGTVQGLLRDVSTPRGLPLATWDKTTFDSVSQTLDSTFGIPKRWLFEINTYDAADVLGASVGVVSVLFAWNSADTEAFARIAASIGLSAAVSTNPLLLLVTVVALARAFHKARRGAEYEQLLDGGVKGAVVSGAVVSAMALVGAASGPLACSLLVGITAGVVVSAATKNVSVVAVSRFVVSQSSALLAEAKDGAVRSAEGVKRLAAETQSRLGATSGAGSHPVPRWHERAAEIDVLGTAEHSWAAPAG